MTEAPPHTARSRVTAAQRRSQLAEAAGRRFHEFGFNQVSLADVAADVGVTAPAVYRHFRNKQDLLAGAIHAGIDTIAALLRRTRSQPLDALVAATADLLFDRPDLWTLIQRERKFLRPDLRREVEQQFETVVGEFESRLLDNRPALSVEDARLLVTAATAAMASPAGRRSAQSRAMVTRELSRSATAILEVSLAPDDGHAPTAPTTAADIDRPDGPESRRLELLDSAIDLFFERGYTAVSMDDIGAAVGMVGPSIYHYYPTKADILVGAFGRAVDRLIADFERPAGAALPPLADLVGTYIDFCLRNRQLVGLYATEDINLPDRDRRRITAALRERVSEWTDVLVTSDPRVESARARVRSGATLALIDDVVRLGHFHLRPAISADIRTIAMAALEPPVP